MAKKKKVVTQEPAPQGISLKLSDFKEFFEQSQAELKKVVWPTRKETLTVSWVVLLLVAVMSIYLGLVDLGLVKIIESILS